MDGESLEDEIHEIDGGVEKNASFGHRISYLMGNSVIGNEEDFELGLNEAQVGKAMYRLSNF